MRDIFSAIGSEFSGSITVYRADELRHYNTQGCSVVILARFRIKIRP